MSDSIAEVIVSQGGRLNLTIHGFTKQEFALLIAQMEGTAHKSMIYSGYHYFSGNFSIKGIQFTIYTKDIPNDQEKDTEDAYDMIIEQAKTREEPT